MNPVTRHIILGRARDAIHEARLCWPNTHHPDVLAMNKEDFALLNAACRRDWQDLGHYHTDGMDEFHAFCGCHIALFPNLPRIFAGWSSVNAKIVSKEDRRAAVQEIADIAVEGLLAAQKQREEA